MDRAGFAHASFAFFLNVKLSLGFGRFGDSSEMPGFTDHYVFLLNA